MSKKLAIIIIIALVFSLGLFFGYRLKSSSNPLLKGSQDTFQAGWDAAHQKLVESGAVPGLSGNMEVKSISGTLEKIDGSKLTVKIAQLDPLADPGLDERIVDVDSNTKIFKMVQKDPAEFQKEEDAFSEAMKNGGGQEALNPPMPFGKKEINLSEIKEGQLILVTASDDIRTAKEFKAAEIDVQ